jgi:amidase
MMNGSLSFRSRFALVWAIVLGGIVLPVLASPGLAQTDEDQTYYDDGTYYEDGTYADDGGYYENGEYVGEEPVAEEEIWRPSAPYRPLDFSAFTESLGDLTPEQIASYDDLVLEKDVHQLTKLLESGLVSSRNLVLYYVNRIQKYDAGALNSVVELNPDALSIAEARDEERASGQVRGPLHGIPVLLKDNIATGDMMHTTAGAVALTETWADHDSFLVQELRDAGAIILGKTNMTEWANWMHMQYANGYSAVGGQVFSPYGDWLDPSGSSTGSAVAVTSNFAPLAIGTETIGSIISPSSRASIVGMHPSLGLISRENVIPLSDEFDTPGPMGKTVSDVAVALTVLAGSGDPGDAFNTDISDLIGTDFTNSLNVSALEGTTIGILATEPEESDGYNLADANMTGAIDALVAAGAELVVVRPDGFPDIDWWNILACDLHTDVDSYLANNDTGFSSLADIVAFNYEDPAVFAPYGQERLEESVACELSNDEIAQLGSEARTTAQEYMASLFETYDIDALATIDDVFALEYGLAGCPAITVPRGVTGDGAPTGLTLIAPYKADSALIGYAYAFERAAQLRMPPEIVSGTSEG